MRAVKWHGLKKQCPRLSLGLQGAKSQRPKLDLVIVTEALEPTLLRLGIKLALYTVMHQPRNRRQQFHTLLSMQLIFAH